MGKDGTRWQATQPRAASVGRLSDENILWCRPGPIAYAATRAVVDQEVSFSSMKQWYATSVYALLKKVDESKAMTGESQEKARNSSVLQSVQSGC